MQRKLNQFILLLLLMTMVAASCGVFSKDKKTKFCGCPPSHR